MRSVNTSAGTRRWWAPTGTVARITRSIVACLVLLGPAWGGEQVWATPQTACEADISGDGIVNGVDLAMVLATWGVCTVPQPIVTAVSPTQGLPTGGTTITVTGLHLSRALEVRIGGVPATGLEIVNDTTIRAVSPPGALGTRDVTVTTSSGSTVFGAAFTYSNMPWAQVLEGAPDPSVVTDASLRLAIFQTGYPWRVRDIGTGIEMVLIPPGTFLMGASPGDTEATPQEYPAHMVTLTNAFYIGRTEVTQGQWVSIMQVNYSRYQGDPGRPIDNVLPLAAADFCGRTGLRLPTEAEWEWACRAGTTGPRYGNAVDIAWYSGNNPPNTTRPVKLKLPNGFGLYDMIGNAWEYTADWGGNYSAGPATNPTGPATGTTKVFRGGSYTDGVAWMRSSMRLHASIMCEIGNCSFRVARNP